MNTKLRLIVMNFLQFAVWGAYLTSMGTYLFNAGLASKIGLFYACQGIVSMFMPAIIGIIADRYVQAQKMLGICHTLAAAFMLGAGYYGLQAGTAPDFGTLFTLYALSVAFYMPTLALSNSVAYTVLRKAGEDTVKAFPPIRVFGTVGFICSMLAVDFLGFQSTAMQYVASGVIGLLLGVYAFTLPSCPTAAGGEKKSLVDALGLKAFALFKQKKMAIFFNSASDSLFFSNCQEENGEACAIFAGPFTVTHHKSTLLIAGMFSFMNAGSGSNQSNHMYKLGPIHQGALERGAKTTSDSYILWPAKVGAFSLVMGRHVNNADTSNLPFSYLIEQQNTTYLVPGVNLRSVGTIRDAQKWPKRDKRKDPHRLDQINYNLLSPYTIQKMMKGRQILKDLRRVSGETSETYAYQSAKIKNSSLNKGIQLYETAIHKFLGNSLIKRLEETKFQSDGEIRDRLLPDTEIGSGEWVDVSGLIAPKSEIEKLMMDIESGMLTDVDGIHERFVEMHRNYYTYEWTWAYEKILSFYGLQAESITAKDVTMIVKKWQEAVVGLDKMVYADAKKEFSLSAMTGFGADGSREEQELDFEQVRGVFESNPFVTAVLQHIEVKTALGNELIERISPLV